MSKTILHLSAQLGFLVAGRILGHVVVVGRISGQVDLPVRSLFSQGHCLNCEIKVREFVPCWEKLDMTADLVLHQSAAVAWALQLPIFFGQVS